MLEQSQVESAATAPDPSGAAAGPGTTSRRPAPSHRRRRHLTVGWDAPIVVGAVITVIRIGVGELVSRFARSVFPVGGFPLGPGVHPGTGTGGFFVWDTFFYQSIATHGYPRSQPAWTPFFPLYPELARAVGRVTGLDYQHSALIVSWGSLFLATWGLVEMARRLLPDGCVASRAGWLLCFFPASVFLIAGYAESTFVAVSVWTILALLDRRPWAAAAVACLAGLTRPEGATVGLAVVLWSLMQPSRRWIRTIGLAVVSESGFVAFSLFLWARFGSPLEEFHAQQLWGRQLTWPFHPLVWSLQEVFGHHLVGPASGNISAVYVLDDACIVAAVVGFAVLVRMARSQPDLWWIMLPSLLTLVSVVCNGPIHGGSPESDARYVLCMVPLYLLPARFKPEWTWSGLFAVSACFAVLFQAVFNLGGWLT